MSLLGELNCCLVGLTWNMVAAAANFMATRAVVAAVAAVLLLLLYGDNAVLPSPSSCRQRKK